MVDLGGLTLAGLWASRQRLPGPNEVMTLHVGWWNPVSFEPIVYVWPVEGGHCVGRLCLHGPNKGEVVTRHPVEDERQVWNCAWLLLQGRPSEVCVGFIQHDVEPVLEALEAQREEMNRGLEAEPH